MPGRPRSLFRSSTRLRAIVHGLVPLTALTLACSPPPVDQHPKPPEAKPFVPPPATEVQLPTTVAPSRYRLDLSIDPVKKRFSGVADIDVTLAEDQPYLVLHGRDLVVSNATVRGEPVRVVARAAFGQRDAMDEILLVAAGDLTAGPATIHIEYDAPFGDLWGLYRVDLDGKAYAFTQLEAIQARRMFPCFDEPRFKTPFELTIRTPKGMQAFANTAGTSIDEAGGTRFVFAPTRPLPTYLVAVAVGDLDAIEGPKDPAPVRLIRTKGDPALGVAAMDASARVMKALEEWFATKYAYGKLDIVAVPEFGPGAMENAGLVTFRDDLLLTGPRAAASAIRRQRYVIAHEFAHQWFGDLVTMKWWDDLWLNEGFATWMQATAADAAFPGFFGAEDRVGDKNVAMNFDVLPSAKAVRPKVTTTDQIFEAGGWSAYQKGAAVLSMIEHWAGASVVRKAIQDYLHAHEDGAVTSDDLFAALDQAAAKNGHVGPTLSAVAASFLDQPGVPLVSMDLVCDSKTKKAKVDLRQEAMPATAFDDAGAKVPLAPATWITPVCIRPEGGAATCAVLDPKSGAASIELASCPKSIAPNDGETGYYRYRITGVSFDALVASPDLSPRERAGILLDAWALVKAGIEAPSVLVTALRKIDTSKAPRVVVQALVDVLTDMRRALPGGVASKGFAALVHAALDPVDKRLGAPAEKDDDETRLLRALVVGAIFDLLDDDAIAKRLEPIAAQYAADPEKVVDRDLGALALRVSARAGGAAAKPLGKAMIGGAKTPWDRIAITVATASAKEPAALDAALGLFLDGAIRGGDVRYLKQGALRRADTIPLFHAWMKKNWTVLAHAPTGASTFTSTVGAVCDDAALADLSSFLGPELPKLEGAQRAFDEGAADARRCIAIRAHVGSALAAALSP